MADETPTPRGRKIGAGKKKAGKSKVETKKGLGGGKRDKSKARPVPEFPTGGSSCG